VSGLLEAGVDLLAVQELVGHANTVTTSRYDRRPEVTRREAADRLALTAPIVSRPDFGNHQCAKEGRPLTGAPCPVLNCLRSRAERVKGEG